MNQQSKAQWIKYAKQSLIEASVALLLFWALYAGHRIEFVRSLSGDTAFSYLNSLVFWDKSTSDKWDTPIVVYKVDKGYFQRANMLDKYGDTNYGYPFPRSKIAGFIEKIDNQPTQKQPLAFFIDYDMRDGSASYDNNSTVAYISDDDRVLLKQLAKDRSYPILFAKTSSKNFIESYAKHSPEKLAKVLASKIASRQIIFVGADFLNSSNTEYRYNPMIKYSNSDSVYYHIALIGWQLRKNSGAIKIEEIEEIYDPAIFLDSESVSKEGAALFKSNILFKNNITTDDGIFKESQSKWSNLRYISALKLLKEKDLDINNDTIVMLGGDYQKEDWHKPAVGDMTSGVMIHAQALKTVLFLDGKLGHFSLKWSFVIIFIIFFTVTILVRYFLAKYPEWVKFVLELVVLTAVLLGVSSLILLKFHQWFNWFMPIIIFYVYDVVIITREYFSDDEPQNKQGEER